MNLRIFLTLVALPLLFAACPKAPEQGDQHAIDTKNTKGIIVSPNPNPNAPDVVTGTKDADGGHKVGRENASQAK